ncbi:MAG: oligosaccharide flippase family protein [Clostridia bacterium]|nr:oligosaccharide flippase family protein [Clostridia bacterium]
MQFLKKILIYFIGTIFNKLIIFILLPIYTRHLSPTDYGNADLSITTVTMLVSLLYIEVWTPLLRLSYDKDDSTHKAKVYCNSVIIALICTPIYIGGCIIMGVWQNLPYMVWMILYGLSILVMHILQFEVRAIGDSKDFMISGMISSVSQLILSFVFIYVFHMGAQMILISPAISNFLAALYIEVKYKLILLIKKSFYSSALAKQIVRYSIPLAINAVAFWAMTNINRYFSRAYLGEEANGYIALATKFISLINTLVQIFSLAWQESAYEHSNNADRSSYYSNMLKMYIDLMSVGTVLAILFTNILFPYFIGNAYSATQMILPIYYVSAFGSAISSFYGHIFNAEKKTDILLYSTLAGAGVNILLLFMTINKWQIYAVPIALALGYCVNVAMRAFSIGFTVKIKFDIKRIFFDILQMTIACILIYANVHLLIKALFIIISSAYLFFSYKRILSGIVFKLKNGKRSY